MACDANSTSCISLLERRDRLIARFRSDLPVEWPPLIAQFLSEVSALSEPLPPGVLLLVVADLARQLDRLAPVEPNTTRRRPLLATLDMSSPSMLTTEGLCQRFEDAVGVWCTQLGPGSLIPEVQARRVAEYIDQHFAEPITLSSLSRVSGWCTRQLSRAFRSSMQMSIREYLQATRIDHAAARLRQGDKVESVLAVVGWRGRKNFFRHFKQRLGTTPAQYRDGWTQNNVRAEQKLRTHSTNVVAIACDSRRRPQRLHRLPRSPRSHNAPSNSNCGTV